MLWPLQSAERAGRALAYAVAGAGPPLLLPWCNLNWFDFVDFAGLARTRRVIVTSPFGFGRSGRATDGVYLVDDLFADLWFVCDAVGVDEVAVFGYSFTGALAARLACTSDRVNAVAAGGFPLLGSYSAVHDGVERKLDEEPGVIADLWSEFDPRALVAFYRSVADLPPGDLVDRRRCPMHAFWGESDEVLRGFDESSDLRGELSARGVTVTTLSGVDHDEVLLQLDEVLALVT